jgi:Domain of unknown function (DUF932)
MPDEIYENRFVGVTHAWHHLGTLIEKGLTSDQVMVKAGLKGWDVKSILLTDLDPMLDGKGMRVLVRHMGEGRMELLSETLVEGGYAPISNEELFGPMIELMVGQSLPVDAAGVLGKLGNRAFVTFDAGEVLMPGGEKYQRYIVALANHSGRDACRIMPTGIRVVCANTERAAIASTANQLVVPHNHKAMERFYEHAANNREMLGLVHNYSQNLERLAANLQQVPFPGKQWKLVMDRWTRMKEDAADTERMQHIREIQKDRLEDTWSLELRRAEAMGQEFPSVWTAFQTASTYAQHFAYGGTDKRAYRSIKLAVGTTSPVMGDLNKLIRTVALDRLDKKGYDSDDRKKYADSIRAFAQ